MRVSDWGGVGWFTWNGGKVVATASSADFITLTYAPSGEGTYTNSVWVGDGGAILDTAGNDITVNCSLIAAGSGGLTKLGAGTLTCTGTNTYTGATTVNEGTLVISSPTLAAASTVIINANAVLKLDFAETITVAGLTIGGLAKPPGVYNALNVPGRITGTGSLLVSPPVIITITRSDSNVVLTWEGGGVLQSATNVVGPYTDVTGSSSPWTITPTGVQGYYRVRE
jgi:autotransporter-associated beta strand protein